jgi:long-subunit acyl-CoA synthetase (AMP-forming)
MFFSRLDTLCRQIPQQPALHDTHTTLSYTELLAAIETTAASLRSTGIRRLGLLLENSPAWVIMDLAALHAGITIVPLPGFFSRAQLAHVIEEAGIDALCTGAQDDSGWDGFSAAAAPVPQTRLFIATRAARRPVLPAETAKITFTSGTTGTPKGVCLDAASMFRVAESLVQATAGARIEKHLCLLPLSLLLENIAGVYAPLLAGATVLLPDSSERGLHGSQQLDIPCLLDCLHRYRPDSLVLVPQILKALTATCQQGLSLPDSLRFVAVGGARVAPSLLTAARGCGIPAYEGYGLSECASVVALNTPTADRAGSVGKPLPHVKLRVADDGVIHVAGSTMLGYAGQASREETWQTTGDLGFIDADGYLHLTGRKKNLFVTAYGRNVNPEWPESELTRHAQIAHAVIFGEARHYNTAVIDPAMPQLQDSDIALLISVANETLPDYARIHNWIRADAPFTADNGLLTASGKPRRNQVWEYYRAAIESFDAGSDFQETA